MTGPIDFLLLIYSWGWGQGTHKCGEGSGERRMTRLSIFSLGKWVLWCLFVFRELTIKRCSLPSHSGMYTTCYRHLFFILPNGSVVGSFMYHTVQKWNPSVLMPVAHYVYLSASNYWLMLYINLRSVYTSNNTEDLINFEYDGSTWQVAAAQFGLTLCWRGRWLALKCFP